jgi:hypothetical protein
VLNLNLFREEMSKNSDIRSFFGIKPANNGTPNNSQTPNKSSQPSSQPTTAQKATLEKDTETKRRKADE